MMFNGDLIKKATNAEKGSFLANSAADNSMKPAQKISHVVLSGLARPPHAKEIDVANRLLLARKGDTTAALQDIWWAVLNSNEFIINH